ncbi:MAG TPA: iron-sulfur cluster carrier protein ApbC [Legionella sp.]|nr:iron-sulfur cluster carrier protein ApbC [Legionella sp.]
MTIEQTIITRLLNNHDPVLNLTLEEMGIKPLVALDDDHLTVNLSAGFPTQFLHDAFIPMLTTWLSREYSQYEITITLDPFIKAHETQLAGRGLRGVKNTIAIASGKGGVGKSTVTVNLAIALARAGARVGILDADIYGPSIPLMMGKTAPVKISGEHYLPVEAHGVQAMSIAYLTEGDQALIWRGPMLAKSLIQMLDITQWDDLDYLLIDLPPGTGDIQLTLVQKIPLTGAVVVTTPQQVATLDAQKALTMFERTGIHVLGVIENMALHTCSQCGHEEHIFGKGGAQKMCGEKHVELLGQLPLDTRIAMQCDEGIPTAVTGSDEVAMAFIKTALRTAIALSKRPLNYANKFPPIVAG